MSLNLTELKRLHDKGYNQGQITRERASDDMVFYWVTQWDDNILGESQLQYRGEFNILRKAGRQIMADLRSNVVQVDFEPKAQSRDDGADMLDGLYRSDDRINTTLESYDNATTESVVCGIGAWELYTEYETNRAGNDNQVIRRKPVIEANNNCYFDPNAKRLDKSDMKWASILEGYSEDGYKDLVFELTGEELQGSVMESFSHPEESYSFPWAAGQNQHIYVSTFYHKEKVKDKIITFTDPLEQPLMLRESDVEEVMDELIESGYKITDERVIKRWEITQYIASGAAILSEVRIAGENIPVVPVYGERAFIEGEEHYEGVTRLAKDPQRLRNFQLSYLSDIVSRSPRPKPIFLPEQIQGFEPMYEENGSDNNYPYLLQQKLGADGSPLPLGPVGLMPEQPMPLALAQSIELSRQAVEDVANPGLPQDIADPDVSGKAVLALQARLDQQSMVYQQNLKHAKRRDGEIYASMASEVYDTPREISLTLPDGTRKKVQVMEAVQDKETGEMVVLNDITNVEFEVYSDIGPSFSSKKEQTIEQLGLMAQAVAQTDPAIQKALILKQLSLVDGVAMDDIRDYANKQLVTMGFKQAETEEEQQLLAQAQQNQQPDAAMVLAQAEQAKAQAQMADTQRKAQNDAMTAQNNQLKLSLKAQENQINAEIDQFRAATDRMDTQIDAEEAGAKINYTNIQSLGQQIENARSVFGARASAA